MAAPQPLATSNRKNKNGTKNTKDVGVSGNKGRVTQTATDRVLCTGSPMCFKTPTSKMTVSLAASCIKHEMGKKMLDVLSLFQECGYILHK